MEHHLKNLHLFIVNYFNMEELRTLCFNLNIDFEILSGQEKQSKALQLILFLYRRGDINTLLNELKCLRSHQFEKENLQSTAANNIYQLYELQEDSFQYPIRLQEFRSLVDERTRNFVGRDFIFKAITDLLDSPQFPSGYIVLQGEPGIGKTSIIAQMVKQWGYVHHFNIAAQNIRSSKDFLTSVCTQLIVQYNLNFSFLKDNMFEDSGFLLRLLKDIAEQNPENKIVILVDAIDEASDGLHRSNALLLPSTLPPNVYFILTTREKSNYKLVVERQEKIYLQDADPDNLKDIEHYIKIFIRDNLSQMVIRFNEWDTNEDELISTLVEKSQGNFMYVVHVLNDIRAGKFSKTGFNDIRKLPLGLREYYFLHWRLIKQRGEDQFEKYYKPVICLLATVLEPVTITQLANWTNTSPLDVREVIDEWREFLNKDYVDNSKEIYRLYHKSFQDFLREEVGLKHYHNLIAQRGLEKIQW